MKTRIAIGASLLLALGSAVAGTLIYSYSYTKSPDAREVSAVLSADSPATPETIAMWKATAASVDYIAPKVPI